MPSRALLTWSTALLSVLLLTACGEEKKPYAWQLPPGFPEPFVPADNPMSEEKVVLGRYLFYDERLSGNGTMACASCHEQKRAFSDGKATPTGSTGQHVARNSPGLANVAYLATYTWANPVLDTLEKQAVVPLFAEAPIELGMGTRPDEVLQRLRDDARYPALFREAFPDDEQPITKDNVVKAIASFQRTLLSGNSPYDRYLQGDINALSASAKRGLELFFGERAECYHCHSGPHMTNSFRSKDTVLTERDFQNTGLYNVDSQGAYPADNTGLFEFTGLAKDMGRFRVPGLSNVALTAPYMHDGSIATLEGVLDHYMAGGRDVTSGPYVGDGRTSPLKNPLVRPFDLNAQERADLIAFLESLTDTDFVNDPRFSNPFEE
ncbi:methanobactin export MATE transporter MbnM [Vitiosangium sp. GDMCC 1.1324]|uniref:methanobactin export MATE transporter MbnM n=1 Tax=Vitiosangium sp. (strain GDMCC 1.1324) TaxID=2138576 RepID=UPI000D3724A6|nr:methanobactin export MATE transporter MbnM [Vitiosangium sp. GDMCC 1.1324]PTL80419.1 di-heme enzyme [Vitiosangium sp. GDMCC 1.1324]